jgi:hypothetical protein
MVLSQIKNLAEEIMRGSLLDYTKEEMLSPEEAETFKKVIKKNVETCLSGLIIDEDVTLL